ncbi:40S ribosomal protein S4-3 [Artemisia annua]|uniref:40S ribosomal protein S4-3 n=1 Tax=Artemisia annua TaxID=35608 RepID=A0A2U1QK16_ARTAN|nr:40S ribosomal protein S4-3 [Artemisia annua]
MFDSRFEDVCDDVYMIPTSFAVQKDVAFDKIRLLSLTNKEVLREGDDNNLEIQINLDKESKILSICDRGVAMTKEDLIKNLGTIAKSRTSDMSSTSFIAPLHVTTRPLSVQGVVWF